MVKIGVVALLIGLPTVDAVDYSAHGVNWTGRCSTGQAQSPIILPRDTNSCATHPTIQVLNRSGSVKLAYHSDGITGDLTAQDIGLLSPLCTYDSSVAQLTLAGFHFHSRSEHRLEQAPPAAPLQLAAELHFVFKDAENAPRAVIGYMLDSRYDQESSFLKEVIANSNKDRAEGSGNMRWTELDVLKDGNYFTYQGSLTTPNCDEGVSWYVKPLNISLAQEAYFTDLRTVGGEGNFRHTQELHDRVVSTTQVKVSTSPDLALTQIIPSAAVLGLTFLI